LTEDDCVFLLLHGNAKNRGAGHRIAAYKIFQSLGCHTLTLDYRGYGDSVMSWSLNETTLVEDAKAAIRFIRDNVGPLPKLFIYGHSMGTGVSGHAAAEAMDEGLGRVDGVIIDSPFHSFKRALESASFISQYFDVQALMEAIDIEFDNVKWFSKLKIPVRIFHASCDPVTPVEGARRLLEDVRQGGKDNIDLVLWEEDGLGHIGISKTKTFKQEIEKFIQMVKNNKSENI